MAFLKSFLCHSLHKLTIIPGDFWDHCSDEVRVKELRGNIRVRSLGTHHSDLEIEWLLTLSESSQLGHPDKLLIQLLQQRGCVDLFLGGLQKLRVQFGELLHKLGGTVKLLS